MQTPVFDFARLYATEKPVRCHTPGHKGAGTLGCEALDITEVPGADSLYAANGILAESEKNAAALFGTAASFYSAEGSSLCVRAMLFLTRMLVPAGKRPVIVAGRNAHSSFIHAAALLDFEIVWLLPRTDRFSLCSCPISPEDLQAVLTTLPQPPAAVFVTSPDYLGATLEIAALAEVSHRFAVPLLVDNAHGAYLRFLSPSLHPMDCGADLCCDSAHKTLSVLTGGAYLHVHPAAPAVFAQQARKALQTFGSTSPSYLILESLDLANRDLAAGFSDRLLRCTAQIATLKESLIRLGWRLSKSDPLRLTVEAMRCGYAAETLAARLRQAGIVCEYAQAEHLVLLLGVKNTEAEFVRILQAFREIPIEKPLSPPLLSLARPKVHCTVREALFAPCEVIAAKDAGGRVLGAPAVSCPPAVPVVVSGEIIAQDAVEIFQFYGIETIEVLR